MKPFDSAALRARAAINSRVQTRRLLQGRQTVTLLQGARVETATGPCPVEILDAGDQLVTRTGGLAEIIAVRSRKAMIQTVRVSGHASANGSSQVVPWDQRILVRDRLAQVMFGQPQAVVPAYELVDGVTVCDLGMQMANLVILEFARPHVIYANGLELAAAAVPEEGLRPAA
ncbi:Hint domain-containing protein [Leisingera sp.]|uniref:Hint domain-containing protein n=1 Tax=Leisingera sp. TaxID=1879318 RepID=UPI003A8C8E24